MARATALLAPAVSVSADMTGKEPCYDDCQIPPSDEEDFSQVPEGWDD